MNETTLKALRGSIRKWEAIVAGTREDHGWADCPLCALFHPHFNEANSYRGNTCAGCPVMARTGLRYCMDTPYWHYVDATDDEEAMAEAAKAELDFLKSLLPTAKDQAP